MRQANHVCVVRLSGSMTLWLRGSVAQWLNVLIYLFIQAL